MMWYFYRMSTQKLDPARRAETRDIATLAPYAKNSRKHSAAQVRQIAASIREFGFTIPVLISEYGTIIAGHCRVMAAQHLGITDIPVIIAEGWTTTQIRAYVIADNRLAQGATWDLDVLGAELASLEDFDLRVLGFVDWQPTQDDFRREEPEREYAVQINVEGESEQLALIAELRNRGLRCRALTF